jgi:UDP-N-acetylmuramoyl-L-alanyl-D-glutamate--2,6-diaminopimelate ligase
MEVSSHALALHRADAIHWAVVVFTNLTQDHLDFHPSMDEYFLAKRRLFDASPAHRIANVDDEHGRRLARDFPGTVTVGIDSEDAELRATRIETGFAGSSFHALGREWRTSMPGRFNVLNALCAIAAARALGAPDDELAAALPQAARAPGRFEPVDEGQDFAVLVDYAHTPDSLENALRAARALTARELISVFGCGGDRDRGKRAPMGEIGARLADLAIVTSDNPRSEDPAAIIGAVLSGVPEGLAGRVEVIEDRRSAIHEAIARARAGDVVVIAGKGHEQGQELAGGVKVPFDDVSVAREALRAAGAG